MAAGIGIAGMGTLGRDLAARVERDPGLSMEFVYDVDPERTAEYRRIAVTGLADIPADRCRLVVELTRSESMADTVRAVLPRCDVLAYSAAGFAEEGLVEELDALGRKHGRNLYISHGALIGLDGVSAARDIIENVRITTTRPPAGYGLAQPVTEKTLLFEGSAREACRRFPHNVNIHAALAMHGLGFDRTRSRVTADPDSRVMRHEVEIEGRGIEWRIQVSGRPMGERNAAFIPESVYAAVRRICLPPGGLKMV